MCAAKLNIRVAVGSAIGPKSSVWRFWSNKDDIYAAHRSMAHIDKISFHASGICRCAFTAEYGTPPTLSDRAMTKWRRLPTPPLGEGKGSCVLTVIVPTILLSATTKPAPTKSVVWLTPRSLTSATVLELFFTAEPEASVQEEFARRGERQVVTYFQLPSRQAICIAVSHSEWGQEDLCMPASGHESQHLIVSSSDPYRSGRPYRLTIFKTPKDGDALLCHEFGAYKVPQDDPILEGRQFSTLSRDKVIARNSAGDRRPRS